jgi:hypothetical protein
MSQITLRGMDDEVEKGIRRLARQKGESLRKLAGGWSKKQAAEFLESIKSCEQIDEAMCK